MTTTTSSTSNAANGSAILTALGAGSGIDTTALVTNLVSATYDPKDAALKTKETANAAKISQLATLNNGIDAFSTALQTLVSGGTLATQPASSNPSVLTATAKSGASIGSLSQQISVRQLAQAQSAVSGYYANAATAVGTGTLTVSTGGTSYTVTIGSTNNTLAGIARAINAGAGGLTVNGAATGVTASVVTDANGARLSIKGATGAANAFTIAVGANADGALAKLGYDTTPGMAASGAAVVSAAYADAATAPVGRGSFALTGPGGSASVTIDASNDNLNGLAGAINAAGVGLTAAIVTDAGGAHLSITDGSGSAPAMTLTPASGAQAGLARLTWPAPTTPGLTRVQTAQDAIVRLDGVDVTRTANTIDDLVDGVTLKLVSASPAETVSLTATRPTAALKQGVADFVEAYNELQATLATATAATVTNSDGTTTTGALYGNSAARQMQTQLARLSSTILNSGGGPRTLADIGVATNRDGTLKLDDTVLTKALTNYPDAVEAMFNPGQHSSNPLITITSPMGAAKPGTYTLTNIVAPTGSTPASGLVDGTALVTTGDRLYASVSSAASGLVIAPQGDVASATITVDIGLGGALKAIRDSLRATGGVLDSLSTSLTTEKTDLASQRTSMTDEESAYRDRLVTQFAAMNTRVSNFSAIKSYLTQQIAVWTKDNN